MRRQAAGADDGPLAKDDCSVVQGLQSASPNSVAGVGQNELKAGDRVLVVSMNNGQAYVVLDRAVFYR